MFNHESEFRGRLPNKKIINSADKISKKQVYHFNWKC